MAISQAPQKQLLRKQRSYRCCERPKPTTPKWSLGLSEPSPVERFPPRQNLYWH
jgi:hypothetical protein